MFCRCPQCGVVFHVRLAAEALDRATWVAKHAPDTKPGELPAAVCFACWKANGDAPPRPDR